MGSRRLVGTSSVLVLLVVQTAIVQMQVAPAGWTHYGADKALAMAPAEVREECKRMQLGPLHALCAGGQERLDGHDESFPQVGVVGSAHGVRNAG